MKSLPRMVAPDLLVGTASPDDAAVYRLRPDLAIVLTIDVFTPIVDDPYTFGAIAATNALSDIYAMGGTPLIALNFAGFPRDDLPLEILGEIQRGAADVVEAAGALIVGGHCIDDPGPKFGLAVVGQVHPDAIFTKGGARPSDVLILTKPLGTGIVTTAIKHDAAAPATVEAAVASMRRLNRDAAAVAAAIGVHAMTDVTGFGLLGHLREMMDASGMSAVVFADNVPYLPGARELLDAGHYPGGAERNLRSLEGAISWDAAFSPTDRLALADPQTSGGLLMAVPPEDEAVLRRRLNQSGELCAALVGRVLPGRDTPVHVSVTDLDARDDE